MRTARRHLLPLVAPILSLAMACTAAPPDLPTFDEQSQFLSSAPEPLPAAANVIRVPQDYATIQEAVDAAGAGDRILVAPGTYHGTVSIIGEGKNGLQLIADGKQGEIVLQGEHMGMPGPCYFDREPFCPEGRTGIFLKDVTGMIIRGFTITDFGMGAWSTMGESILLYRAHYNRIEHNILKNSDMMGVSLFRSGHNVLQHNIVHSNDRDEVGRAGHGCGFHLQDVNVPGPGATTGNVLRKNVIWDNPLAGIMLHAAGPGNEIIDNVIKHGAVWGILNQYTTGTVIRDNVIHHHHGFVVPNKMQPWQGKGYGIYFRGGSTALVEGNQVMHSLTYDLFQDGSSSVTFERNRCTTSNLTGPCN